MKNYDLIIIGGGPSGLNCAISAHQAGLNYLVLEKGVLANSIYHFPDNMTFFSTSKRLEVAATPFISHGEKPTRSEALEYYRRLREHFDLQVNFYEEVQKMDRGPDGQYRVTSSHHTYQAPYIVVATGFYDTPRQMEVPGEDLPKVKHYYDNPHLYVGQRILVVGAANSACDVALETWQKGAEVTMVIRGGEINDRVKYWIRPNIENRIKEGSIKAYFHSTVREIRPTEVTLNTPQGAVTIGNDFVLAMTGYHPNFDLLHRLGLTIDEQCDRSPEHDPETLETNLPGVFLAGVVCGGMQTSRFFIENTRDHGDVIIGQIRQRMEEMVKNEA